MRNLIRGRRLATLLLLLACLTPFLAGIHGPFLHDDQANLQLARVGDPSLQGAYDVAFRNHSGPFRRPLANLSFAANYWWLGSDPLHFKLFNLLLHGLCGLVVYGLSKRLLSLFSIPLDDRGRHLAALTAMMLWTLHPLQVSTVLYSVQRMAQIAGLFTLASVWLLARWMEVGRRTIAACLATCLGFLTLVALGVGGKESAVLAPLLAGVVALLAHAQKKLTLDRRVIQVLGMCVVLPVASGALFFIASPHWILDTYATREFTLEQRLLTEGAALWHYMRLIALPWIPAMGLYHDDFPIYGPSDWQGWASAGLWLLTVVMAWRYRERAPLACFAVLWFLAAHMLESTFIPLELVYEHRNYVALFGPALWAGTCTARLLLQYAVLRKVGWLIPALLLAGATLTRSHQWSSADLFTIYEHAHHPNSIRATFAEAGRRAASGDNTGAAVLYSAIQARTEQSTPGKVWPLMLDPLLQCRLPGHPAKWQELRARIRINTSLDKFSELSSSIVSQLMSGTCKHLELEEYRDTLKTAWSASLKRGDGQSAESAAIHLAWTGNARGEISFARLWLRRAADTRPDSVEPLFDLAYLDLNAGELDEARRDIIELDRRATQYSLPIGYRISELERYLNDARGN